jgi:beta-galactosidase
MRLPSLRLAGIAIVLAALRSAGASPNAAPPAGAQAPSEHLPVAVWYGGGTARAPMLEADAREKKESWRKDVRQIRALGFTAIRCWIDWASGEREPGRYTLETLDVLLELAEEEGLQLIVQVYMDSAPAWIGRAHPDARFVSSGGQVIQPETAPGYCVDHEAVRKAELAFYGAVAERLARSRAAIGVDLWSEPHVSTGPRRPSSITPSSASARAPSDASGHGSAASTRRSRRSTPRGTASTRRGTRSSPAG